MITGAAIFIYNSFNDHVYIYIYMMDTSSLSVIRTITTLLDKTNNDDDNKSLINYLTTIFPKDGCY